MSTSSKVSDRLPAGVAASGVPEAPPKKGFIPFAVFCADAVQEFLTNNAMQMAAAIAFYSFFSLFPLAVMIIIGYDRFGGGTPVQEEELRRVIGTFIPVSQQVVAQTISTFASSVAAAGPLAFVGLIWASTAVFATLRKGINTSWNIKAPRPFLKERVIDLSLTAGAGILFMLLLYSTSVIRTFSENSGIFGGPIWQSVLSLVISFAAFSFLYWFLPNRAVRFRDVLFGALIGALSFEVAKAVFFYYAVQRANLNQVYGSLTSVAVLLGWLYLSAALVLIGALIAAIYSRLIALGMVSHWDVWSLGMLPLARGIRQNGPIAYQATARLLRR